MTGSSPLARGLPRSCVRRRDAWGIIPARAGFTTWKSLGAVSRGDHPRSRGVYVRVTKAALGDAGSSPLARGLLRLLPCHVGPLRIIPARAGFTSASRALSCQPGGSSPLARGLLCAPFWIPVHTGIIPARAGFTRGWTPPRPGPRDHPRSRGVYARRYSASPQASGSSPLARGLPLPPAAPLLERGIIPARAGFTARRLRELPECRDHPRSRGVYAAQVGSVGLIVGSSPLARGLHSGRGAGRGRLGIIPARAGFTVAELGAEHGHEDHPRSRGVYQRSVQWRLSTKGSSPLARGLHH